MNTITPNMNAGETSPQLSWSERLALAIGIFEIPLQLDTYLMYHDRDAGLGAVGGINFSITLICLGYLYFVWLAGAAAQHRRADSRPLVGVPMICYFAAVCLSVFAASLKTLALFDVVLLAQAYALFFYLANRLRTRQDIIFCVVTLSVVMTMQAFLIFALAAFGQAGETMNVGPIVIGVWEDGRPAGSVHSPVSAGSLLAIMWLPVIALAIGSSPKRVRSMALVAGIAGLLAILLTQTRGAIITVVVGSAVIGFMMARRLWLPRWSIALAVVLAMLSAYPLLKVVTHRVSSGDGGSAEARKHLAAIAIRTIRRAPLFGHGAGNCHIACATAANSSPFRSEWYYTIHCKYLLVWVETGLIGLCAFLLVMGNSIRHALVAWFSANDRLLATIGLGLAAAILGHMVHMLVDIFNSRSQVQMLWVILGLTAAIYNLTCRVPRLAASRRHAYVS